MAWNQPGNSSNNDHDPWTGKPKSSNSNSNPPDLEAALRDIRNKLTTLLGKKKMGSNSTPNPSSPHNLSYFGMGLIAGVIFLLWLISGIFIIGPAEQAVILRLGQYVETVGPGPHWIPRFIETNYTVNEQKIANYSYDSEMLTKDENIVSVAVAVQYRIGNARDYLFSATHPIESLQQATASALRQIIGHTNLDKVLTTGRDQIRQEVQTQITKILARYNTGLLITDVAIQPAKAPDEVKEAFDDAIKAQEDEQRFENQAEAYAMQVEPTAKGQAQRFIADAKAYQQQVVLNAKADVARFLAILPEYAKAPSVTRDRLYIESIENVLQNTSKVLVDSHGSNNMFYLPLDKIVQKSLVKPAVSTTNNNTSTSDTTQPNITNRSDKANTNELLTGGYE